MRVPNSAHSSRPWRIHELTRDFRLEDVWALPTPGGPDDFPRLVQLAASLDPSQSPSRAASTLFAIRWRLGELLGWDRPNAGVGSRVPTLRDRLPADLRDARLLDDVVDRRRRVAALGEVLPCHCDQKTSCCLRLAGPERLDRHAPPYQVDRQSVTDL